MLGSHQSIVGPGVRRLLVWLAVGAIVVAACSGGASPSPAQSAAQSATPSVASSGSSAPSAAASAACPVAPCDKPIVIGVSQALTGDKSDPGTGIEHGYLVWVKEMNDAGGLLGRKVELKEYDNQSLADTAVSQMERLVTVDKVDLLFGPFSSALTIPTSAIAEKYKYAFIEGAGGAPGVFDRKFQYTFFVQPATAEHQADPFVSYILSLPADQRPKTAAYPQQDDPFVKATEDGAQATLEAAGIKTVYHDIYPPTQTDFASIAAAGQGVWRGYRPRRDDLRRRRRPGPGVRLDQLPAQGGLLHERPQHDRPVRAGPRQQGQRHRHRRRLDPEFEGTGQRQVRRRLPRDVPEGDRYPRRGRRGLLGRGSPAGSGHGYAVA